MDHRTFDRISRIVGGLSRRNAVGAAGAAIGASLLAAGAPRAEARPRANRAALIASNPYIAGGPEAENGNNRKRRKACQCKIAGAYNQGVYDTTCSEFHTGAKLKQCQKAGLACANLTSECKFEEGTNCFVAWSEEWVEPWISG